MPMVFHGIANLCLLKLMSEHHDLEQRRPKVRIVLQKSRNAMRQVFGQTAKQAAIGQSM
jgi:hypothetical protein